MTTRNGFTMVEMMVALAIGLIITLAVSQVYLSNRDTYGVKEELSRLQENARFAVDFLARDLRMAGYMGCNSKMPLTQVGNIVAGSTNVDQFDSGLRGFRYACTTGCSGALTDWDPPLPPDWFAAGDVMVGSDVVIVKRASDLSTHLTGNLTPTNAELKMNTTANLQLEIAADDVLMVADCKAADVFRATTVSNGTGVTTVAHSTAGNTGNFLINKYGDDAELMKLISRAYYIGKRGGDANAASNTNPPSLFRKELSKLVLPPPALELVEGVERMVLRYGEDTNNDRVAERYRQPGAVTNFRNVVSVRMALLMRTVAPADTVLDERPYTLLDVTVPAANDRLRRRVFTSTVDVRNH